MVRGTQCHCFAKEIEPYCKPGGLNQIPHALM